MSKFLHYLIWTVVYLGFCLLCDYIFEDVFSFNEIVIRVISFLVCMTFIQYSEKKGWNSWSKLIGFFKRKM